MVTPRTDKGAAFPFKFIDGLTRRQQEQIYEDLLYLSRSGTGTRWGTVVVASSTSSAASRDKADFRCTGANDNLVIKQAISWLLGSNANGGRLVLLEGTYNITNEIAVGLTASQELVIEGLSTGSAKQTTAVGATYLAGTTLGTSHMFTVTGGQVTFKNLSMASSSSAVSVPIWCDNGKLTVTDCNLSGYGGIVMRVTAGGTTDGLHIENCTINASGGNGITSFASDNAVIAFNTVTATAAGATGIVNNASLGSSSTTTIIGNVVISSSSATAGIGVGSGASLESVCIGNTVRNAAQGILVGGSGVVVTGNLLDQCAHGIVSTGAGNIISGNNILHTLTPVSCIEVTGTTNYVLGNEIAATPSGSCITVNGTNHAVVFNNGPAGGPCSVSDSGTGTKRESDWLLAGQSANINARVGVRKNTGGATFLRRRVNFIEGSGITVTLTDDAGNEEVDVNITSAVAAAFAQKGDILAGLASGTFQAIHVDSTRDGTILVTDSNATEGVKWGPQLTISKTAPANPRAGDIWMDTT